MLNRIPIAVGPEPEVPVKQFMPCGHLIALHVYRAKPTDSGVYMPDGSENPIQSPLALVIAVGPLCTQVKEGDTVIFGSGTPALNIWHKRSKYTLVKEEAVAGVVDPACI